jgi:hypothetical protein
LAHAQPLAERLLDERLANLAPAQALLEAARVVAARPSTHWEQGSSDISFRLGVPMAQVHQNLLTFVKDWNADPCRAAQQPLRAISEVRRRMSRATQGGRAEAVAPALTSKAIGIPPPNRTRASEPQVSRGTSEHDQRRSRRERSSPRPVPTRDKQRR